MQKLTFLLPLLLLGCTNKQSGNDKTTDKRQYLPGKNLVGISVLQKGTFHEEMVENGKLRALHKSALNFGTGEKLVALYVKNGGYVQKGQPIARLRQEELRQSFQLAKANLAKARLELQDLLIGQGYDINDSLHIPPGILEVAKVRSGYTLSALELSQAATKLNGSVLIAPFSGIVANIRHNVYEQVGAAEEFCTLIDNSMFEASFSSLETEIQAISLGREVTVMPFSMTGSSFKGQITEINPVIDENGLISVKATIKGAKALMDGMNVKVYIKTNVPDQLVVPRSAVLLRDNREVLFKYVSGTAFWIYVQVLHENSTSYTVIAHPNKGGALAPGDTIIVSGNLNLAHESEVELQ